MKNKTGGEEGGLINFPPLKREGAYLRVGGGGLIEDLQ